MDDLRAELNKPFFSITKNIMYKLYKKDHDEYMGMLWGYGGFFSSCPKLEYYYKRANIILRKDKIEKIKNGFK